jgi:hypothetical protein
MTRNPMTKTKTKELWGMRLDQGTPFDVLSVSFVLTRGAFHSHTKTSRPGKRRTAYMYLLLH